MNVLEKILGLNDSKRSGHIALACTILCIMISLVVILIPFGRKTQGYINWYVFIPVLLVGLFNSINALTYQIKIKDLKSLTFLFALPIPIYALYVIIKIIT